MKRTFFVLSLFVAAPFGQEKPASSLADIIECVRAKTCKNATPSTISWADYGADVQIFKDEQSLYALALSGDGLLNVWVTLAGEPRPGRQISVGAHGRVLSAELGRQPGESFPMRMTPEQTAEWRALRKAYRSSEHPSKMVTATWGEQYKSFWQEQADAAVAAIRRTISK